MEKMIIKCMALCLVFAFDGAYAQKKDSVRERKINEVVITAYGIKKEKKSLGYVYQDIKGTSLVDARENNVTNALIGKVSGLQVVKSAAGPAASSKIILRGYNSLTGDNQPLIVVDGVPMANFVGAGNNDFWNPSADMGNGLSDLNPEDIENVTVLKGGAASALYGSRAGNGVIMITTKTGKGKQGAGITYSTTVGFSDIFVLPPTQKVFGQGSVGAYDPKSGSSWGPQIQGQQVTDWRGQKVGLQAYDNVRKFFSVGTTNTHNLTLQQSINNNTNLYSSVSYMDEKGITPQSLYERLNLMTRVTTKFGANNNWHSDIKVQYMNSVANNRPVSGATSGNNYLRTVLGLPNTMNILDLKPGMDVLGVNQIWWNQEGGVNPYWAITNIQNKDIRNRFLLNGELKYSFTNWLDAGIRVGSDMYNTKYEAKAYTGGSVANTYSTGLDKFIENNYIINIGAHKDNLIGKWSGALNVFGQIMTSNFNSINYNGLLRVPNHFSVNNIIYTNEGIGEGIQRKQINSLFATADINYDGFWFLNVTAREDWSSTMSYENRNYFYPSISTSLVISDMIKKLWDKDMGFITFAKIRGSYAVTGNPLKPYQLYNQYGIGSGANGTIVSYLLRDRDTGLIIKFNPNVVAELLKTYEAGINLRFFNRVDLDVNYYDTHAVNQLVPLPMNPMSGYQAEMINAGNIQNKGIEIVLNADIFRKENFKWNMLVNYSKNNNNIIDLHPGVDYKTLGYYDTLQFRAVVGQRYGAIYGTAYQRVKDPNSPYNGKIIVDTQGLPTATSTSENFLGDQTPRGLLGITNSFIYKNFGLSFQVDGRFGGQFFSGTTRSLLLNGLSPETVVNGGRDNFVVDGVVSDGSGGYKVNSVAVTPQNYWTAVSARGGNLGINEAFIYDATNVRLRNVQITYSLPKSIIAGTVIQNAKASFAINNVWMIYSKLKGIDPESIYATSSNAVGYENLSFPSLRSYLLSLTLGF